MRQVTELRFDLPAGRWSLYLLPPPLELAPLVISRKHLNEWFQSQIGLSPKQYARVARFQWLISSLTRSAPPHRAELAHECGFYDQAHLVHDCRAFAGMTPTALHAALSPDGNGAMEI